MDEVHRYDHKTSFVFHKILTYPWLCFRRRQMLDPYLCLRRHQMMDTLLIQPDKQATHFYQMTSRNRNSRL